MQNVFRPACLAVLRIAILCCLFFSFFPGPWEARKNTIFLLDVSGSVACLFKTPKEWLSFYEEKIEAHLQKNASDRVAVIYFADGAEIAIPFSPVEGRVQLPPPSLPKTKSDLHRALLVALSAGGKDPTNEIVVFSDGQIPEGSCDHLLSVTGKSFPSVSFHSALPPGLELLDAAIHALVVPSHIPENGTASGYVVIKTSRAGLLAINLFLQEKLYERRLVRASKAGTFRVYFSFPGISSGFQLVRAVVESLDFSDLCPKNDSESALLKMTGPPRFLVVGNPEWEWSYGKFETVSPEQFSPHELQSFQALVIASGNAFVLGKHFRLIRDYVFSGGSLVVFGGEDTLGPGGYGGTPLEEALPVWCAPEGKNRSTILLALDISGSMGQSDGISVPLQEAKEAVANMVFSLRESDIFSLATFSDHCEVTIPFAPVKEAREKMLERLTKIVAHGGTDVLSPLRFSYERFLSLEAPSTPHLLIVSDGMSDVETSLLLEEIEKYRKMKITISVISIGNDPKGLLKRIATEGGGRFYDARRDSIGQSLQKETMALQKEFIKKTPVSLKSIRIAEVDRALSYCDGKKVNRMVCVDPKDWGKVALENQDREPVLVFGEYGLGKSAVLTTHWGESWGGELSKERDRLTHEIVNWVIPMPEPEFEVSVFPTGNRAEIDVIIEDDRMSSNRMFEVLPEWSAIAFHSSEKGPGKYFTRLPAPSPGNYKLAIRENVDGRNEWKGVFPCVVSYEAEYRELGEKDFYLALGSKKERERPGSSNVALYFLTISFVLFFAERFFHFLKG